MADGPTPPKGWLLTGVIFLVLSLAGCGAGAFGCASFVNDLQKSVDQGGETPLGTETTFTATGSMGAILTTDPTSTTCEGTDGSGSTMSFNTLLSISVPAPRTISSASLSTNRQV